MSMSTHDRLKRSVVRQMSKSPRFTAVDFRIPPGGANIDIQGLRARAVKVIGVYDYNRLVLPDIVGTDTEACRCHWEGVVSLLGASLAAGPLNGAGDLATFAAAVGAITLTTTAYHGAAVLTLPAFQINGTCQPSATAAVCNVAAGVQVVFPGGAAGAYALDLPIFSGAVVPACPGDATFNGDGAVLAGLVFEAESTDSTECESTWTQPAAVGFTWPRVGYVHLNRVEDHVMVPPFVIAGQTGFVTLQAVPIPPTPMVIRVEQEFDWLRIESASTIGLPFICQGIVIIEHETEYDLR
jgi:hypothetical protein